MFVCALWLIGQVPGSDQLIDSASRSGHWEAVAVAVLLISLLAIVVGTFWAQQKRLDKMAEDARLREERLANEAKEREARLSGRVSKLEGQIETKLFNISEAVVQALSDNTAALKAFSGVLSTQQALCDKHAHAMVEYSRLISKFETNEECTANCLKEVVDMLHDSTGVVGVHKSIGAIAEALIIELDVREDLTPEQRATIKIKYEEAIARALRATAKQATKG